MKKLNKRNFSGLVQTYGCTGCICTLCVCGCVQSSLTSFNKNQASENEAAYAYAGVDTGIGPGIITP